MRALEPGGHLVVALFLLIPSGPEKAFAGGSVNVWNQLDEQSFCEPRFCMLSRGTPKLGYKQVISS